MRFSVNKGTSLNSINKVIFVMVKWCVYFEVRTELLILFVRALASVQRIFSRVLLSSWIYYTNISSSSLAMNNHKPQHGTRVQQLHS
jgi:hypothetical protein